MEALSRRPHCARGSDLYHPLFFALPATAGVHEGPCSVGGLLREPYTMRAVLRTSTLRLAAEFDADGARREWGAR